MSMSFQVDVVEPDAQTHNLRKNARIVQISCLLRKCVGSSNSFSSKWLVRKFRKRKWVCWKDGVGCHQPNDEKRSQTDDRFC